MTNPKLALSVEAKILIAEILDFYLPDEKRHFEEAESRPDKHIYLTLVKLQDICNLTITQPTLN
jgi:hypothetical protein